MSEQKTLSASGGGHVPVPKMRRGFKAFFNDVLREMKQVHWPKPQETNRLTGVVFIVCLIVTGFLYGLGVAITVILNLLTTGRA